MPIAKRKGSDSFPTIGIQRVNNLLPVDKYFRSANLLVRQANEYRAQQNELQLYTMLMRLASLVVETIPSHKDFDKNSSEYRALRKDLNNKYMKELENVKISLRLQMGTDASNWMQQPASHTPDTVQISTSNLPELDWNRLASHPSAVQSASGAAPLALDLLSGEPVGGVAPTGGPSQTRGSVELPTFQYSLRAASQASKDRHALLPKAATSNVRRSAVPEGPLYPQFDASPYAPINYGPELCRQSSQGSAANVDQQMAALDLMLHAPDPQHSLMDAIAVPRPSPPLGPQELEVQNMLPPCSPPEEGAGCQAPVGPPPLPQEEQPGGVSEQREIREVHVSMGLMEEFLAYARSNTSKGIESCGILAGLLDTKRGLFSITTLIVPKQEGTSDTVQALAEEEIFDVQDKRGLYPMGWIHTHPTQTCFLSSIDVHTQCGYQTMLDEAVAIVMAPSDRTKRCGIFRLSTPGGLKLVQKCQSRGFHAHPPTETGQPVYELCGHVYLNERLKHDVVDLR